MRLMDIVEALSLRPINTLSRDEQLEILSIRNQDNVRLNMYSSHIIPEDEHFSWIENVAFNGRNEFYGVFLEGKIIGGVSLNAIDRGHQRADWAYYLDAGAQGHGVGSCLEFKFLSHVLEDRDFQKLNCEVLEFNEAVIKLHKKFGFKEEGVRRHHILREGERLNTCLLGITKDEWLIQKKKLSERLFR